MKILFKKSSIVLALFVLVSSFSCAKKGPVDIVLLHTNDHHGSIESRDDLGGLAQRLTFVKQVRAENENVLLVDAGDINTGSPVSNMFSAEPDIEAYNLLGYDCGTFGNHEFDKPLATLDQQMKTAKFPFVSANILRDGAPLGGQAYIVKEYNKVKVGIFGLTTLRSLVVANPDKSLTFNNEIESAKAVVKTLQNKEKCDIIICLAHLGDVVETQDPQVTSHQLATEVAGINIIVDGHSHTEMAEPVVIGDTYIVSAHEWGKKVGKGLINYTDGKVSFSWEAVSITAEAYEPDSEMEALLTPYLEKATAALDNVIGQAAGEFEFGKKLTRYKEMPIGNMVCDGVMWYMNEVAKVPCDFTFCNGGSIRAPLAAGDILVRDVATVIPFDNILYLLTLKGTDVIALFDFIGTVNQGAGAFPQVSKEVRYTLTYDENGQNGSISNITINGQPIDPNKSYKVLANDYVYAGGDGYVMLGNATEIFNTSLTLKDVIQEYISAMGTITPATDGRIEVIGGTQP
ncbi:MAG: 5'-nucleotidase C-terminal domain-containing protein [Spirochaetaceae bacterium]|nr:5'-nucleotidase C-terminal domain-containing protein [Spirochaetaceae bacterium]